MSSTEVFGVVSVAVLSAALLFAGSLGAQAPAADLSRLSALETELTGLEHDIQLLEDTKAIKRLQRAYGYYVDKKLSREIGALFADAPETTAELGGSGVYVGKARIAEYYDRVIGGEGLKPGQLFNHMILQGVVHVADDGRTAKGRWRALIQIGEHEQERSLGRGSVRERVREGERRLEVRQGSLVPNVQRALLAGLAQVGAADGSADGGLPARPTVQHRVPIVSVGVPSALPLQEPRVGPLRA